jgi:hypothetical protein
MKYLKIKNYPSSMLNGENWGGCDLYLKFNETHRAIGQMEFHANGKKLRYHWPTTQGKDSLINDLPIYDEKENFLYGNYDYTFIPANTFNQLWLETLFDNQDKDGL